MCMHITCTCTIVASRPKCRHAQVLAAVRNVLVVFRRLHKHVFSRYHRSLFFPFPSIFHRPFSSHWRTSASVDVFTSAVPPPLDTSEEEELQAVRWAIATLATRGCYWPVPYRRNDATDTCCLVPFGDMLNFALPPEDEEEGVQEPSVCVDTVTGYDAARESYLFVAEREYPTPGEEVCICYCQKGNWDLIRTYGFSVRNNWYTAIKIAPDMSPIISTEEAPDTAASSYELIARYGLNSSWYFERGRHGEVYPSHNMLTALRIHYGGAETLSEHQLARIICGESLVAFNLHDKEVMVWKACLRTCALVQSKYGYSLDYDQNRLLTGCLRLVANQIDGRASVEGYDSQDAHTSSTRSPIQTSLLLNSIEEKRLISDMALTCQTQTVPLNP
eukprot:GHVS01095295.1.p1 GENE.GHVS01095295.1~~GHVS01095295.1.p1  ORF type:complete len:389 (-),score=26.07 GHVS01095295.1:75-1241(-)